ncbi:hypothetical protein GQ457_04G016100 [Hibiscus cannabinus]
MESKELNLNKECNTGGAGNGFIDRSKVRILLCDNDAKSCEEVFSLLLKCSYQVTSVRSARQVIDALNAEGPEIDIILTEVDLPITKGMKLLKYIMRNKELRHIPVISMPLMSAQDEVSIVVKCLRLGAADYLVKPLRTNELLNLWTHMWRRRRELGLMERNILNCEFDLVASDPSDANTNSTTLFSDDTDDRFQKSSNPEMGVSTHQEDESAAIVEPPQTDSPECRPDVPGISDRRTGQFSSVPKKSELRIGESSAFVTYVKSSAVKNSNTQVAISNNEDTAQSMSIEENLPQSGQQVVNDTLHENIETWENNSQVDDFRSSSSIPDSLSLERSSTPVSMEFSQQRDFKEDKFSKVLVPPLNEPQHDASGLPAQSAYLHHYMPEVLNQVMMPSSTQLFQNNLHDLHNHISSAMVPQYNHLPPCIPHPHVSGMTSFPYYPVNMCMQPGRLSTGHSWPSFGNSSSSEVKPSKVDRREAALIKFRQKRNVRCFDKKIRYVNRKKLAERRPRVRGQFVRKNGVTVDLNGQPSADYDEEGEEDQESRDSSPEDDMSGC